MDASSPLTQLAEKGISTGTFSDVALQVAVLAFALLVGYLARSRWTSTIDRLRDGLDGSTPRSIAMRSADRLFFPFTLALIALLGNGLFKILGLEHSLLDIAIPLTLVLAAVRTLVFLLRVAAGPGAGAKGMERSATIVIWLILALHLLGWLPIVEALLDGIAFSLGDVRISLLTVIKFFVISGLLVLIAMAVSRLAEGRLSTDKALDSGVRLGLIKVIRYGLIGFAVLVALSAAGLDLTTLTIVGGALGIGVGFGLQKIMSNLISGFLLLFDRSIRPGDVIAIGDKYGWIAKMGARYVVVRDLGGVDTLIPNEELITSQVQNWSYGDRAIRVTLPVEISYGDDPEWAMTLLLEASETSDRVIADPPPAARLKEFGDNGVGLELVVWIQDPENGISNLRSDINLAIWRAFKAHGVTIPYPQRDLHVREAKQAEGTSQSIA